jgi:hypothetical protein
MLCACRVVAVVLVLTQLGHAAEIDFNRDIKPILSNNCFHCHGPDADERQGGLEGLRLDTADGAYGDQGGHAAVVPGSPEKSVLLQRVLSTDPDAVMPPPATGKQLSERDRDLLRQWIAEGAQYAPHWSYVKPVRPEIPQVKQPDWARNEIDRFLLARMEREGLQPAPEAGRHTLIRRLSLALTGLPPTPEEVNQFVNDPDPAAYEKLVDRLLEKEAYGENWARLWLDLARYADSAGYADDPPRTIWLYRDYVIRALNRNVPFDQFTIEQLAGDLLPNPTEDQLIATAFHRNTLTNNEGGTNDEEFRNAAIVDRVNTTLAVWMGTTMACAQCHTHKFDPITQEEYFRVFAILNNTADADLRDEAPVLSKYTDDQQRQKSEWEQRLEVVRTQLKTPTSELIAKAHAWADAFPRDLAWTSLTPTSVATESGSMATVTDDVVRVTEGAKVDTYTVTLPLTGEPIRALKLETLVDPAAEPVGAGHAGGNFVITGVSATVQRPSTQPYQGRFIRIEIPGKEKILSLAEVQVFEGTTNHATAGKATQSTTAYEGPPELAIDGDTDGRYYEARSTTHTAISDNPWWEVDLGSVRPVDRVAIWNRTDGGVGVRLKDFKISLLGEDRKPVWESVVATPPDPNAEYVLSGAQSVGFSQALADYSQPTFLPEFVLKNPDTKTKGWAVGGAVDQTHRLVLMTSQPLELPAGSVLTVRIEQQSQHANHTLGRFRIATTNDDRAALWAQTPATVLAALNVAPEQRTAETESVIINHYLGLAPDLEPLRKEEAAIAKQLKDLQPVTVPVFRELPEAERRVTRIQRRGNFLDLSDEVQPGIPAVFALPEHEAVADRLGLAKWLVSPENPLTARVLANRYWEKLFGVGIVATSEEFGSQGEAPFHPELLDWLATEIVRLDWDMKALVKLLVTSAAFRQESRVSDTQAEADPDNRFVARGPRFRMTAEMIRDQALAVSGLLSPKLYGPPVNPPQPNIGLSAAFGSGIDWKTSTGEDRYRRGLYTTWRRSNPYPSMATFDAPNREVCTLRRGRTNTPLQALVTLNDPVYVEAAQALARRMIQEGGESPADKAAFGLWLCLGRQPRPEEAARLTELYNAAVEALTPEPAEAVKLATDPLGPLPEGANPVEYAAWTTVGNVLLNLDEFLMVP